MKEKRIYRISAALAIIGIFLIYASSLYLEIEQNQIGNIERSWAGKNVMVTGNITQYSESGSHAFLEVEDSTGSIKIVNFDFEKRFEEGDRVNVTGHVELYKGQLEIIVKEIELSQL